MVLVVVMLVAEDALAEVKVNRRCNDDVVLVLAIV